MLSDRDQRMRASQFNADTCDVAGRVQSVTSISYKRRIHQPGVICPGATDAEFSGPVFVVIHVIRQHDRSDTKTDSSCGKPLQSGPTRSQAIPPYQQRRTT
ncbi:MAG: hypothetical protein CMJ70_23505 [Planctomycetaceae bacterium]|nr:hypothetical protein [Planctomycetaceae bacterium]